MRIRTQILRIRDVSSYAHCYRVFITEHPFFEEYKRRSVTVGERVTVLGRGEPRSAVALAIDGECRLVVRYDDGSEEALNSGEISVRK